ncbi:MAG: hypothetical protein V3T05_04090, partial [Myxococcota bacterium]
AGVVVLLEADIGYLTDAPVVSTTLLMPQARTPLMAHFDYGDGRVFFTSIHLEADGSPQPALREVLNYVVFEL